MTRPGPPPTITGVLPLDFPAAFSYFESHRDNEPVVVRDATWGDIAALLGSPRQAECTLASGESRCKGKECPHKLGPAWSPVTYPEGATRGNKYVEALTCAVFDLDHVTAEQLGELSRRVTGHAHIVHSTHNHDRSDVCLRLVMPLSRPVSPKEWPKVWAGAIDAFAIPGDRACKDAARLFFLPVPRADVPYLYARAEGQALDVEGMLARAAPSVATTLTLDVDDEPTPASAPGEGAMVDVVGLTAIARDAANRKRRSSDAETVAKGEILKNVCEGKPIATPGGRDHALNRAAGLLAFALPLDTPIDAALQIMSASIRGMDCEPEGVAHWMSEAHDMLVRAQERAREVHAEREARATATREVLAALAPIEKCVPEIPPEVLEAHPDAWRTLLKTYETKAGVTVRSCAYNAAIILRCDPTIRGCFRWNELSTRVEVHGGPFADVPRASLPVVVANWLAQHYEQNLTPQTIREQLGAIARENRFNPVREYLDGLVWDGVARCDEWLESFCGATVVDTEGGDISAHVRRIGARWMISAVARALDPGCKVDTVLVLEGAQGIGKSSAFEVLGGKWFCDTQINIGDKDSRMLAASSWIIELAELASFKRTETEQQKAFFTARKDDFRPPYGTDVESFPRRCVFVGTTNDASYLIDNTGHRRFWPVAVGAIDKAALKEARDQLWAEAVVRYKAGEPWWLTQSDAEVAEAQAQSRAVMTNADMLEERVRDWWYGMAPSIRPEFFRADEVLEKVLNMTPDKITTAQLREARVALERLGFSYTRRRVGAYNAEEKGKARAYGFEATARLKQAPQTKRHLASVPSVVSAALGADKKP